MKRTISFAAVVAVLAAATASGAFAGEVKGPPGTPCGAAGQPACTPSTNFTGAPENANSNCAYSGLNDMNNGQTVSIVQTAADSFKYYHFSPGVEGTLGFCQGGTNLDRGH